MSVKSLPDAMRGDFWPRNLRLHPLLLRLRADRDAAGQPVQQHLRHRRHRADHHRLRGARRLCARPSPAARRRHRRHGAAGFAVFSGPRRLDHQHLRDPALARPDQQHQRPDPALCHAAARDQHPDHAQHVPARAARNDRSGEDRRRRPLADAVEGRPADGAQRPGRHLHRQFRHRLGRVSAVRDADRRRGQAHHAGRARRRPGRPGPMVLAQSRGGLRDRRHARASSPSPSPKSCSSKG